MAIEHKSDGHGAWGAFDTERNAFVVDCEECGVIVGQGPTLGDAHEDADENDAYTDRRDEGSGDTFCRECYERLMDEAMRDAMAYLPHYRREQEARAQATREDDMLARADLAFDAARDRGEI